MKGSILIADDEKEIRETLSMVLEDEGYKCHTASDGEEAIQAIQEGRFDILITDLKMPGADGIEVLQKTKQLSSQTLTIIITAHATVETAVEALRQGASDYILKPVDFEEVIIRIQNLLEHKELIQENRYLREQIDRKFNFNHIIGESEAMKQVYDMISRVSNASTHILITGASGTGKELVARAIHSNSDRSKKPFLALNCGSIPDDLVEAELFGYKKGAFTGAEKDHEGIFEAANGGTVFLDEIGELPPNVQVNLLRVLQEKEVKPVGSNQTVNFDARIITATNRDLKEEVEKGNFREDLYFRLNVVEISMPSLSERKEDIPVLTHHFLNKYNRELNRAVKGITSDAMTALISYDWRGNVRELENVIERAVLLGTEDHITIGDLPASIRNTEEKIELDSQSLDSAVQAFEKHHIKSVLKRTDGNKSETARLLGIDPSTLYRKMERYRIEL
ncbi:sigma-54 dependent transcriptional regulator [Aliifodinibius sp. S!AR15-10]|uniref:sigma-54-dependent transcriptional regulator n=1 Tax=Aliifodinibius sp. S!AR15-10 TaxID=2950437 RepID=UPI0028666889|nr:sigma-54 dependent transcriptional regulator [Aliifodinibius sp. S!AR15-10]MDR8391344.1 sigma-54 dependent transcriptional regulator [Aliifodinibius sp. S!AR15-10]